MSHFTVLVITEDGDYEKALAPFNEELEVEPYIEKSKEQILEEYKKDCIKYEEDENKEYFYSKWKEFGLTEESIILQRYREYWDTELFDDDGNELSTYNPNSKWDWYSLGGRWSGSFKLKEGAEVLKESEPSVMSLLSGETVERGFTDFAKVKDIDFDYPLEDPVKYSRFWEIVVEGSPKTVEEEKDSFFSSWFKDSYYLDKYEDKETFVYEMTHFSTYAILYKGEWIEPGKMGWFGFSSADKEGYKTYRKVFKKIIEELKPDDYLAVVDCHI